MTLRARRLTRAAYSPYGALVAPDGKGRPSNMGTARRWDFLAELKNGRRRAKANLCLFRCSPFKGRLFTIRLLERHPRSTQVFLPLEGSGRRLVIVARGGRTPDLSTLAAFTAEGPVGITYRPGIWHHPMIALDRVSDLACLVWEDGTAGDCEVVSLAAPRTVRL